MSDCTVYYNPRCSKCRALLDLLAARGLTPRLVDYVENPLTADELAFLAAGLGTALVRDDADAAVLPADPQPADLVAALQQNPLLMQRPLVRCGDRVLIARPPERALELF